MERSKGGNLQKVLVGHLDLMTLTFISFRKKLKQIVEKPVSTLSEGGFFVCFGVHLCWGFLFFVLLFLRPKRMKLTLKFE